MSASLRLAEVLCSRLCHDLSGMLAALIGIVEIAHEEQPDSEMVGIAVETAAQLGQRLKLLRAAWGQDTEDLDLARLQGFADSLSSGRRIRLDLSGLEPGAVFQPPASRVVLNILLLAADGLPRGGIIALSGSPASNILITISGPRAAWPPAFRTFLVDEAAAWQAVTAGPRHMQAPLTALLARGLGYRLSILMPVGAGVDGNASPLLLSLAGE
jgi:histidine phosphotransferase ChpT